MQDSNKNLFNIYDLKEYIAIDIETTGLNPSLDKIIEISAVKFIDGKQNDVFSYLLDPGRPIPPFIEDLTGINNQMVEGKPQFSDISNNFSDFIGQAPIVGHNVKFDIDFIKFHSNNAIDFSKNKIYDTYLLSKIVLFSNSEFNLEAITAYYKFPIGESHRATDDSINSGKILIKLLEDFLKMDISIIDRINKLFSGRFIPNSNAIDSAYKYIKYQTDKPTAKLKTNFNSPFKDYHQSSNIESFNFNDIIGRDGILYENSKYQFRESQYKMAEHIDETIKNKDISIIEAGTGLGKTYAYLIPFIKHCKQSGVPLVISTYTKTLQDQLFYKDLKDIIKLMNTSLKAAILKGRYNYICLDRLQKLESNATELIPDFECHDLASLIAWSYYTKSGDIEECSSFSLHRYPRLWNLVRSDAKFCIKNCNTNSNCYYSNLTQQLNDADIIVVNHALLINDAMDNRSLIPKEHFFVIDEAHDLFKAAKDILMSSYDKSFFNDPLKDMFSLIKNITNNELVDTGGFINIIDSAKNDIESFFNSYLDSKALDIKDNSYPSLNRFNDINTEFQDCSPTLVELVDTLNQLIQHIKQINEELDSSDFIDISNQFIDKIEMFISQTESEDYLSWMKFHHSSKFCSINYLMKDIGAMLFENYFQRDNTGILCSATLSVNNSFDFFKSQIGLDRLFYERDISEVFFSSPFFLEDQLQFYGFKSELNINSNDYIENIAEQILEISNFYNKRMLVLCTSYKQASELKNKLYPKFLKKDTNLYVHERGRSKNSILRAFKNNPASVLIGTMAFWEGIDLPGDELSILMMLRIPFSNPNDPYLKYISDQLSMNGKNGFNDYQVPEACLKMKQGFGRLIRTEYDSGLFIITDPRFYNSSYSHKIKNSFPIDSKPYTHFSSLLDNKKNL